MQNSLFVNYGMVMKARQICAIELLYAPLEIFLLLPSNLAQKDLLLTGFGNGCT